MRQGGVEGVGAFGLGEGEELQDLGVVVEHLFEMRGEPVLIRGIAGEAAAELVVDAALAHAAEQEVDGGAGLGVVPAAHVADHHEVGAGVEVRRVPARHGLDAVGLERVAHRRIEGRVAPGDAVPGGLEQAREGAHPGARDTNQVHMHGRLSRTIDPRRRGA